MNGLQHIAQAAECPLSLFDTWKSSICSHPLFERVTSNWKVILMDVSTIVSISSFVITFLMGSSFLCSAFFIVSIASGVSAFYMRQISKMADLEDVTSHLRNENSRYREANSELNRNNAVYRENNQTLLQNNARLSNQVAQLSLHVTQLKESAENIRSQVVRFQQENTHLHNHVNGFDSSLRLLDQQILNSKALCDQITGHLNTQQQGLGQQLEQLGRYLSDLRADNRVHERIQELGALQQQVGQAAGQLHTIQLQYAAERANFQAIHLALVQLKGQFDTAIQDAASNFQANNHQFQDNVNALASERQRIHDLISRHFGNGAH